VQWIVERITQSWGGGALWQHDRNPQPHEAHYLKLDCSKARTRMDWRPRWKLERSIESIIAWQKAYLNREDMKSVCHRQIDAYLTGETI